MNPDLNLFGVFINGGLVSASIAFGLHVLARRVFIAAGVYRFFWHPALVNVALFVIWWGVVAFGLETLPVVLHLFLD